LSRARGLNVTCDVSVFALFADRLPATPSLNADVSSLWSRLSAIDCFSIGVVPCEVANAADVSVENSAALGYAVALPLLFTAVAEGRLTSSDVTERLCSAPRRILGLPEQPETCVEIHEDREVRIPACAIDARWFPALLSAPVCSAVHRVVVRGQTLLLDGNFFAPKAAPVGRDLGNIVRSVSAGPAPRAAAAGAGVSIDASRALDAASAEAEAAVSEAEPVVVSATDSSVVISSSVRPASAHEKLSVARSLQTNRLAEVLARHGGQNPFYMKHVLSVRQFSRDDLHLLFAVAQEMRTAVQRSGSLPLLAGRVMASVFYEPSSRTSSSFQAAMLRLGGQVFTASSETSSVAKGETLEDTVRTFASYADIITLRHPQPGSVQGAAHMCSVPVLNAGDGIGEHPSQAMLDTFTIREEFGTVNGLTITLVGDLRNGRTVHSLARVIAQYKNVTLNYVSPPSLAMPESIKRDVALRAPYVIQNEYTALSDEILANTDVLYITRVQKERFESLEEYEATKDAYIVDNSQMR
ncbi:Carbamoyl-phosphate synthase, partial [Coemansia asiatica]